MERISTGIYGFDELVEGGFPKGSANLIVGDAGTGKTIFSTEFLYNSVVNNKQNCIYFTFEEKKDSLHGQAIQFGWDLKKLDRKKNFLKIIDIGYEGINKNTVRDIIEIVKSTKTDIIVIDSIATLAFLIPKENGEKMTIDCDVKRFIYLFITELKKLENLTTLIISQKDNLVTNSVAKYICDGVIEIEYESLGGDYSRTLTIKKMRKTKKSEDLHPMEITEKGVIVHNLD